MAEERKVAEQTFITPEGAVMAILPLAELKRLREAAEDAGLARIAAEVERKLLAGEDELISWDMSKRLLAGDNPVRVWREHRELTIDKLADAAGISQPYLSQIETGQRDGTFKVMVALARALKIDLDDLAPPSGGGGVGVMHGSDPTPQNDSPPKHTSQSARPSSRRRIRRVTKGD